MRELKLFLIGNLILKHTSKLSQKYYNTRKFSKKFQLLSTGGQPLSFWTHKMVSTKKLVIFTSMFYPKKRCKINMSMHST